MRDDDDPGGGQPLTLLPERAAFLADSRTLLVADAHIGKAVSFRALGVPVPRGTTSETLAALSGLVARRTAPGASSSSAISCTRRARTRRHARRGVRPGARRMPRLELMLVRGNHDDRAGDPPRGLGIEVVDEPLGLDGWRSATTRGRVAGAYVLAGHLHPCVSVGGRAGDRLRLPCFWFGDDVGVLPAFGAFTGMHPIRPRAASVSIADRRRARRGVDARAGRRGRAA